SYELNDIVSQQPEPAQVRGVKVKRIGLDDARAVQATRTGQIEVLTRRGPFAAATFGHVPRPENWQAAPAVFHDFHIKEHIRSAGVALKLNQKLDEILGQVAGQITDPKFATENVQSLLPRDFKGLQFNADSHTDHVRFIQSRSIHSLDELRARLSNRGTGVQETAERATALLQLRSKLHQLGQLAGFIERSFSDLDSVDLGRLKTPQLC
ncbi:MAG TPA: hypothetical protein VLR94_11075, partial [Acidobacteriota bacterium]|nr:hypothetical protein [Acidobacteriota bacterium]